jgi:hypothetical protein
MRPSEVTVEAIEFDTPSIDEDGRFVAWTRHTARQFTEDLGQEVKLEMVLIAGGIFQMGSLPVTGMKRSARSIWSRSGLS